jgi:hypothetical protein
MNKSKQSFSITVNHKDFYNTVIAGHGATVLISHLSRFEVMYHDIVFFRSLKCDKPLLN